MYPAIIRRRYKKDILSLIACDCGHREWQEGWDDKKYWGTVEKARCPKCGNKEMENKPDNN